MSPDTNVTATNDELTLDNDVAQGVTSAKDQARERKRRQRAKEKQVASIEFVRTDASLFLHPDRLSQKAGAPKHHLRRMAIKELVDNALDAAPTAHLAEIDEDTFVVTDNGPGIDPEKVATMFSVTRPMMSSKLIRRPTRGMVGNGNRVVAGAAFASGGTLVVESRGAHQELTFDKATGNTIVTSRSVSEVEEGTRITIKFGPALPRDIAASVWGQTAIGLAGEASSPMLTHPDWYSIAAFDELREAARGTAQDLASLFNIDLRHALDQNVEQGHFSVEQRDIRPDGPANRLTLDLLKAMSPKAPKLVPIPEVAFTGAYRTESMTALVAGANVPAIVQVWAKQSERRNGTDVRLIVNRTPAVAEISIHPGGETYLRGCGMSWSSIGTVPKGGYIRWHAERAGCFDLNACACITGTVGLAQRNVLMPDKQLENDLLSTARDYVSMVPESQRAPIVRDMLTDLTGSLSKGPLDGATYQATRSRIDRAARSSAMDPQLADALHGIRNSLDDAMERSIASTNPADVGAWKEARRQYRNILTIERAITGAGENAANGLISPSALRSATVTKQGRRAYARGQGDFAELARAGEATMKPLPNSGTAGRLNAQNLGSTFSTALGLGAAGYGSGGDPATMMAGAAAGYALPRAAGKVLMSGPMQGYLGNQAAQKMQLSPKAQALFNKMMGIEASDKASKVGRVVRGLSGM